MSQQAAPANVLQASMIQMNPQAALPPPNSYYPEPPNDLTGGLPINLDSLRDGPPGSKPFYPYSTLIRFVFEPYDYIFSVCLSLLSETYN